MANYANKKFNTYTTTNAYGTNPEDFLANYSKQGYLSFSVLFRNTGANPAHVRILGSLDKVNYPISLLVETVVAAGASHMFSYNSAYVPFLRLQAKSQNAGLHTTVETALSAYEF